MTPCPSPSDAAPREIAFFAADVPDKQTLIDGLRPGVAHHVLSPDGDGLAEIASVLAGHSGIDALHIISHGAPGQVFLGRDPLSIKNIYCKYDSIRIISESLSKNIGEIYFYACHVASNIDGKRFVDIFSNISRMPVFASARQIGGFGSGNYWEFDYATKINPQKKHSASIFSRGTKEKYHHTLANFNESFDTGAPTSQTQSFTLNGFIYTFTSEGDGGFLVEENTFTGTNITMPSLEIESSAPNPGTTEKVTITESDGSNFRIDSISFNNNGGGATEDVTLTGFDSNGQVGTTIFTIGDSGTFSPSGGWVVTRLEFSSPDFLGFLIDNVQGEDAPNTFPTITLPTVPAFHEDSSANAVADTLEIADTDGDNQTVTLTVTSGTVSIDTGTGVNITTGDGTDDASLVFDGTLTQVNAALDSLTFTPDADFDGTATIQVQTDDGNGGTDDQTLNVTVDDAPEVVSIDRATGAQDPTNADSLDFEVTFGEAVSGVDATDFSVTGSTATVSNVATSDDTTFTVTISGGDLAGLDGAVGLDLADDDSITSQGNGVALGGAGTGGAGDGSFTGGQTFTVDNTAPMLQSFLRQTPAAVDTKADTLVFRAAFDGGVQNVDTADFAVNGGTTATVTNVGAVNASTYDITVSGGDLDSFDGPVGLDLAGGQDIADPAGNALPGGEPGTDETFTVDNTAPAAPPAPDLDTASDTGASDSDDLTNDTTPTLSGSGAEANATVEVFSDIDGSLGTATADGAGDWTLTAGTLSAGSHTLTVKATDAAGNEGVASPGLAVTVDTNAASIANTGTSASGDTITDADVGTDGFMLTVDFDEAMDTAVLPTLTFPTGGEDPSNTLSNPDVAWSDSDTLTVTYDVADANEVVGDIDVKVNGATDAAGNSADLAQADAFSIITAPAPQVSMIDSTTTDGSFGVGAAIDVTVTFDEAVDFTAGGGTLDATLSNGTTVTLANADATNQTSFSGTYTVQEGDGDSPDLDVTGLALTGSANLAANDDGVPADLTLPVGNGLADNQDFVVDANTPTVAAPDLDAASDSGASASDDITNLATATISGNTEPSATVDVRVGGASVGMVTADAGGDWSFTFANGDLSEGANTVDIVADDGVNSSTDSADLTLTLDTTPPTANDDTGLSAGEDDGANDLGPLDITANDTDAIGAAAATDLAGDNGGLLDVAADGTVSFDANGAFEDLASGEMRTTAFTVTVQDVAGNTATSTVSVDVAGVNDAPTIATNANASVQTGDTVTLDTANLNEGDPDDDGAELTYTVTALPGSGTLALSGTTLSVNDTFTQADIDDGNVTFTGGDAGAADVGLTLSDGGEDGAGDAATTFTIDVTNPPPPPPPPSGGDTSDDDLFTGDDQSEVDNDIDTGLEPTDDFEDVTLDGAPVTRGTTTDRDTGESVEVISVNPVSDGVREEEDDTTADVDIPIDDAIRASISDNTGVIIASRDSDGREALSTVLGRGRDPDDTEGQEELASFLDDVAGAGQSGDDGDSDDGMSPPVRVVEVTPVPGADDADGQERRLSVNVDTGVADDAPRPVVVVNMENFTDRNDTFDVDITGAANIFMRGGGTFQGTEELADDGAPDIDNVLGDASDQVLFFGPGDDVIRAGGGNDEVSSAGGADRLFGGTGDDSVRGGDGDDTLDGGSGLDALFGDQGADTLVAGAGDSAVGGLDGDTLELTGFDGTLTLVDPTVHDRIVLTDRVLGADRVLVETTTRNGEDTAVLRLDLDGDGVFLGAGEGAIELSRLSNAEVAVTPDGDGGIEIVLQGSDMQFLNLSPVDQVSALYVGFLDRAPDPAGLAFWTAQYEAGVAAGRAPGRVFDDIAEAIRLDDEAMAHFPVLDPDNGAVTRDEVEGFVAAVFESLFNRQPEAAGLDYWADNIEGRLDAGINMGDLVVDIMGGALDGVDADIEGDGVLETVHDASTLRNKIEAGQQFAARLEDAGAVLDVDFTLDDASGGLDGVGGDFASFEDAIERVDGVVAGLGDDGLL